MALLIPTLLALSAMSGVLAGSPYEEEPKAVLNELAEVEDNNIVAVFNHTDQKFKARGSVDVDVIHGPEVVPANVAWSQSTCVECKSMTVALQLALYEPGATNVSPENAGVALNIECTRCFTYARAHQVAIPVEDAERVARNADDAIEDLDRDVKRVLRAAQRGELTTEQAMAEIAALIDEFKALAERVKAGEFNSGDNQDDDESHGDRDDEDNYHLDDD
jgi:hypothetical protein